MTAFLSRLRENAWLWVSGWLLLGVCLFSLAALPFDDRTVHGISTWIKPAKFGLSSALYLWSLSWYLSHIQGHPRLRRVISGVSSLGMLSEVGLIVMQAARGVRSHFNQDTPFDGVVFGLMGLLIAVIMLLAVILFLFLVFRPPHGPRAFSWSLAFGLGLFLAGSAVGGVMIALNGHAVGVPDGGPGLPVVNWSLEGGDLRVAHLWGLHALQVIPLVGWLLARKFRYGRRGVFLLVIFSLGYALIGTALYLQARAGTTLFGG